MVSGDAELKGATGISVADPVGLGHHAPGDGGVLGAAGALLLPDREACGDQREHQQGGQHGDGAGAATAFAFLNGVDAPGSGVEKRLGLVIELDDGRCSRVTAAVAAGHPQGGRGDGEPLVVPEVVLRPARAVPVRGRLLDCPGGAQGDGDVGGGSVQGAPPGE
ncbi:MAG: hypothetical protein M3460_26680 [Actinomycetota bacterium]|nr:hypothetical protein [Actinomycetota bacterium]